MDHHPFSPSQLGRRYLCPGSWKEEEDARVAMEQSGKENPDAARGTQLHRWLRYTLDHPDYQMPEGTDEEAKELIIRCLEWLSERAENWGPAHKVMQEIPVEVKRRNKVPLFTGHADFLSVWGPAICQQGELIDWKFGRLPISHTDAIWQLRGYLVAIMQQFDLVACSGWIYQPRLRRQYQFEIRKLDEEYGDLLRLVNFSSSHPRMLHTGDHCLHCAAVGRCIESRKLVYKLPIWAGEPPADATKQQLVTWAKEKVQALQEADWQRLVDRLLPAEAACAAIRQEIRRKLESGQPVRRWKLHPVKGERSAEIDKLWPLLKTQLTTRELFEACKVSLPKLRKTFQELGIKGEYKTKKAAGEAFDSLVEPAIHQEPSTTRLERERGGKES
jgi:hypothetical protein